MTNPPSQPIVAPPAKSLRSKPISQSQSEAISIVKVVLRRWGLLISVVGLMLAGVGIAITMWIWEPSYDAKQFVRVIQDREYTDIDDTSSGRKKIDPKSVMATVMNEPLLNKLLLDENIRKHKDIDLEALQQMVRFEAGGGEQYSIICRNHSPEFATYVTQKLGEAFVEYHQAWRDHNLGQRAKDIEFEIAEATQRLGDIKDKLVEKNNQRMNSFSGESKPADPDGSFYRELLIQRQGRLSEKKMLTLDLEHLNRSLGNVGTEFDEEATITAINSSPALLAIDSEIQNLQTVRDSLYQLDSNHPRMVSIDSQISTKQQQRKQDFERMLAAYRSGQAVNQKKSLESSIEDRKARIARIDFFVSELDSEISRLESEFQKSNKIEFEYEQLLRDQERAADDLDKWLDLRDKNKSKDMAAYQVVIEGTGIVAVPTKPVEQFPFKILGLVFFTSMAIPFAAALALEFRWQRISSPDQFQQLLPLGLLGEVADLPVNNDRQAAIGSKRDNKQLRIYEESVDSLSAILSISAHQKPFVFSVTSAASHEGKTTLAAQLAISAARTNFGRTLLIDADLRAPTMHRLFDSSLDVGLGDVLSNTVSLNDAIVPTSIENLDLLTAGKLRTNPRRYFSSDQWTNLLSEARKQYDQVIVDTPPVLAASESLEISRQCDSTLMCVLRDVSRADAVKRAHERLVAAEVNVIGCAFGGVPQNEYAYRYGSYDYNL